MNDFRPSEPATLLVGLSTSMIVTTNHEAVRNILPALKEGDMTRRCPDITVMKSLLSRKMTTLEEGIGKLIHAKQFITV